MKKLIFFIILISPILFFTGIANAFESSLVKGTAYFNDQPATVENATLKIGEPFFVKVEIKPKRNLHFSCKLSASGFRSDEKQPYVLIEGPSGLNEIVRLRDIPVGVNKSLIWKLKTTDIWAGGIAPLNIDITVYDNKSYDTEDIGFTIVNAYISKEYYQGVTPSPTPSPSPAKAAPGFEFVLLALSLVIALAIARGNR